MSTEPQPTGAQPTPSPYIRTFAKDFAALAAQNPGIAAASKSKQKNTPQPVKKQAQQAKAPRPIKSELDQEADNLEARTRDQAQSIPTNEKSEKIESIELPEINPNDIFTKSAPHTEPAAYSVPTPVSVIPNQNSGASTNTFAVLQPIPTSTSAEPTDAQRSEILARLKAKASAHLEEAANNVQPAVTIPAAPISPAPQIEKTPEIIPAPIQAPPAVQTEQNSPIHTYKSDFSDHLEAKNASPFTVIAAQKDAPQQVVKPIQKNKTLPIIVASVLLLLIGGAGVFAAYLFMNKTAPILLTPVAKSLIASDQQVKLEGSGVTLMNALAATSKTFTVDGTVIMTYVNTSTTTAQGVVETPASGGAFITELNLQAPDILLRNIDPSSMVGVIHTNTQSSPFFILRVTSYERTFAGMLQWENTMFESLSILYPQYPNVQTQTTNTVSTSTPSKIFIPAADPTQPQSDFVDEIVSNHSVRALKDNAGRTLILYGYADKQTLIIARDEAAFTLLIQKLTASSN